MRSEKSFTEIANGLLRDRIFLFGLTGRLVAILLIVPWTHTHWFVPFVSTTLLEPSFDPWKTFLSVGGNSDAFPYGPVMYLVHVPTVLLGIIIDTFVNSTWFSALGFRLSLLLADFLLLVSLCRLIDSSTRRIVIFYWLSPIVFYITYWHGQTDIVPVLLLTSALFLLREHRVIASVASMGLAIAAKLSMVIAAPFLGLFLWNNRRRYPAALLLFLLGLISVVLIIQIPFLLLPAVQQMVLDRPVLTMVYETSIAVSANVEIFLAPTLYLVFLYGMLRLGRMNLRLLYAVVGASFFIVLLLTAAPPGWYLWTIPSIVAFQEDADSPTAHILTLGFAALFVIYNVMISPGADIPFFGLDLSSPLIESFAVVITPLFQSLIFTSLVAVGIVLSLSMLHRAIADNDFFHLSRRPLGIAIAGDSASGKDTLARTLAGLFGEQSVVGVSGDDYHLYERGAQMWERFTHLDPRANDLTAFVRDCTNLIAGRSVMARQYNHETGRFTSRRIIRSNEVIIISGLHALYSQSLCDAIDIKVFLDTDEDLRRIFKVHRDTTERGYDSDVVTAQIDQRTGDSAKHVRPQLHRADIVFSMEPETLQQVLNYTNTPPLKLSVKVRNALHHIDLAKTVVSLCNADVDIGAPADNESITITYWDRGITPDDITAIASHLVPHLDQLLPPTPTWQGGTLGIMQLVILVEFAYSVGHRRRQ